MVNRKVLRGVRRNRKNADVSNVTDANDSGNVTTIIDNSDGDTNDTQDDESGIITVNPAEIGDGTPGSDGEPRKRRGRKPGSKNKPRKETAQNLTQLLYTIHMGLATISRTPEMNLDPEEAEEYSLAIQQLNEAYGGEIIIPPKVMAWLNFGMCTGTIYGTRAVAIYNRKQDERKRRKLARENTMQFPVTGDN